jgi:hypothetical protein
MSTVYPDQSENISLSHVVAGALVTFGIDVGLLDQEFNNIQMTLFGSLHERRTSILIWKVKISLSDVIGSALVTLGIDIGFLLNQKSNNI